MIHPRRRRRAGAARAARAARAIVAGVLTLGLTSSGVVLLAVSAAAAGPPNGPSQSAGSAEGLGHGTDASATRSAGGNGHAPGHPKGELGLYQRQLRKPVPQGSGPNLLRPFDATTSKRRADLATERSDMYQDSAGRMQRRVSQGRVNWKDSTGAYNPIDPTWTASGPRFKERANDLALDIAATSDDPDLIKFTVDATHYVGEGLVGAAKVAPGVAGTTATYLGVLPNIDLTLTSGNSGIDEAMILKSASAATTWVFNLDLQGLTPTVNSAGGIDYADSTGKIVASAPPGFMTDSAVQPGGGGAVSNAVTYTLSTPGGKPQLQVSVDPKWVADPARQFPIVVDPNLFTPTLSATTWVQNTTPGTDASGQHSMAIGTYNSGTNLARSFIDFSGYPGAPGGYNTTAASLYLFLLYQPPGSAGCAAEPVEVHATTASPPWTASGTNTYPGPGIGPVIGTLSPTPIAAVCSNSAVVTTTGQTITIPLPTNPSQFNTGNNGGDIGLAVKGTDAQNSTNLSWKRFATKWDSNPPQLILSYTPDVPPTVTSQSAGSTSTLTPEFVATGTDQDNWPNSTLQFDFQIFTAPYNAAATPAPTPVADSGLLSNADWVVPAAKLAWATNYVWTVRAYDGAKYSYDPGTPFSTGVPQPIVSSTFTDDSGNHGFDSNTGNANLTATDATVTTVGPMLRMARTYNSRDIATNGAFGAAWTSPLDTSVTETLDPVSGAVTGVTVVDRDGHRTGFAANSNGTFTAPQGVIATLAKATGGYTLTDRDKQVFTYTHARVGTPTVYGITAVTDAIGRAVTYTWTGDTVTKATAASGRNLYLTWGTPSGAAWPHVATVATDPATAGQPATAQTWTYTYTGDRLSTVCPPISSTACTGYSWANGSHYPTVALDTNPHSYWRYDEASGTTAADAVTANDATYNTGYNNVTVGSTASPVTNGAATAATFPGSNSWVTLPTFDLTYSMANLSFSLWFKTTTADRVLVGYHDDPLSNSTTTNSYIPAIYIGSDGKLHAQIGWTSAGVQPIAGTTVVTDGRWHQVVLTSAVTGTVSNLPKAVQTLYLDGAPNGSVTQNGIGLHTTSAVTVGGGFNGGTWPYQGNSGTAKAEFFNGSISDVAVYARALSGREITGVYNAANAPAGALLTQVTTPGGRTGEKVAWDVLDDSARTVTDANGGTWTLNAPFMTGSSAGFAASVRAQSPKSYWRMGETSGVLAVDQLNQGKNLAAYDYVTLGQLGPFGTGDSTGVGFDGATSNMVLPAGVDVADGQSNLTVGLWFQTTTPGGVLFGYANSPLTASSASSVVPALYIGTDGKLYGELWNGAASPMSSSGTVTDGAWHYAVISGGGGSQMLYLDGLEVSTTPLNGNLSITGAPDDTIGAGWMNAGWPAGKGGAPYVSYFKGSIAELAYYSGTSGALSADQVYGEYVNYQNQDTYDPVKNITVSDPTGHTITDSYDPSNSDRAVRHTDTLGHTSSTGYDTSGFPAIATDADGINVTTTHDALGNQLTRTTCQNQIANTCSTAYWTYPPPTGSVLDWKPSGYYDPRTATPTTGQPPSDNTYRTTIAYNAYGQPTTVTGPVVPGFTSGRVTTTTYTTTSTAATGGGTTPAGLAASVTDPTGALTTSTYYSDGDLATVTGPTGQVTTFVYDALGRAVSKTAVSDTYPSGLLTAFSYDGLNRVSVRTDPATTDAVTGLVHTARTTLGYDPDSQISSMTILDATGGDPSRTTSAGYGPNGLESSVTDATSHLTSYGYDAYGNRTTVTAPDGTVTALAFNSESQLLSVTLNNYAGDATHGAGNLVTESRAYDPAGRLASKTDAMGWTDYYAYFDDGHLAAQTRADGQAGPYKPGTCTNANTNTLDTTHCFLVEADTWDPAGNPATRTSSNGATATQYTADAAGRDAKEVLDPAGVNRTTTWTFDGDDRATDTTQTNGTTSFATDTTFDAAGGMLTRTVHDLEGDKKTTWTRDKRGFAVSLTDPLGNVWSYVNDEAGHPTQIIAPAAATETGVEGASPSTVNPVTKYGYDTFGDRVSTQDPDGHINITGYDGEGRATSVTGPAYTPPGGSGSITAPWTRGYDNMGRLVSEVDPAGNQSTHTWNQLGEMATSTAAGNVTTSFAYDSNHDLLATTTPTGAVRQSTWDWMGRRLSSTDVERSPAGAYTTTYTYNSPGGWLARTTTAASVVNSATYNNVGEIATATDAAGNATSYSYDLMGRQSGVTRPDSTSATFSFDWAGNPTGSIEKDHTGQQLRTTSATWDLDDRHTTSVDGNGHTSSWGYDPDSQMVSQSEPVASGQSISTTFAHDPVGNRTRFTDGRGTPFLTTYNSWNLPEKRTEVSTTAYPNPADRTWTAGYDVMGRIATLNAPGGVSRTRGYDVRGNLTSESGSGAEASTAARSFGYDGDDRVTTASTPSGNDTFAWDDRALLTGTTGPSGTATFTYNGDGRMATRADAAGASGYTWDTAGRLVGLSDAVTGTAESYTYTPATQVKTIGYGTGGATRSHTFDDLHRLTDDKLTAPGGGTTAEIAYGYDANDNLTSKTTSGTAGAAANTYSYDQANRLTSWNNGSTTANYAYDASGNRTTAGTRTQAFDARNRVTTATDTGGMTNYAWSARGALASTSGVSNRTVTFDAFDELISDTATTAGTSGPQVRSYDSLGRELTAGPGSGGTGPSNTLAYSGLGNEVASDSGALYARDPNGGLVASKAGATAELVMSDRHSDPVAAFTATGTGLAASVGYDPLGRVTAGAGTMPGSVGYQGGWADPATGQVNAWHRQYDPLSSGWDARDPADVSPSPGSGAANRYAYLGGNPLGDTDPLGYCGTFVPCFITHAVSSTISAVNNDVIQPAASLVNTYVIQPAVNFTEDAVSTVGSVVSSVASDVSHAVVKVWSEAKHAWEFVSSAAATAIRAANAGIDKLAEEARAAAARLAAIKKAAEEKAAELKRLAQKAAAKASTLAQAEIKSAIAATKRVTTTVVATINKNRAVIIGAVVGIAVGVACAPIAVGTGGLAAPICGAAAGAAGNLAAYAAAPGPHSLSGFLKSGTEGGLLGGATGGLLGGEAGGIGGAAEGLAGSGPVSGVLEASSASKSVGAINAWNAKSGVEFVFDPEAGTFAMGRPATSLGIKGSAHEQLASVIGADPESVVGGIVSRGANGELDWNEQSGHFWQNWTPGIRNQFIESLRGYGVNINE
jgi:RHS repeat-associated protein